MDTMDRLGYDIELAGVTVTPSIEEKREETIDVSSYTEPVTIKPSEGKGAMTEAVITLEHTPVIEPNKETTLTSNGVAEIEPSFPYDAMKKATVTVAVPLEENRTKTITANGTTEITPSSNYPAMEKVTVTTAIPLEENKTETITANGTTEITPTSGKTAMEKVTVTTAIPLESNKTETITANGTTEITPTSGKTAMEKVTVTTAIPLEANKPVLIEHNGQVVITPSFGNTAMEQVTAEIQVHDDAIQNDKPVTLSTVGEHEIFPDQGYVGMGKVTATVDLPIEANKTATITENGTTEITPTSGKTAMEKVTVTTAIPLEANKTETITENGTTEIVPTSGNTAMKKATVTVAIPIENNKTASIDVLQDSSPIEITPTSGNTAMKKATVTLTNVPVIEANKTETITANGTTEITPTSGNTVMEKVTVTTAIPLENNKTASIDVLQDSSTIEITPTSGNTAMKKATVTLTNVPIIEANKTETITENGTTEIVPTSGNTVMEKATVTVAVPLENNKTASIDVLQDSSPIEITPTSGNTAMKKATVTLTNVPVIEANKTETITENGTTEITPTSGNTVMEKVTVTTAIPLENNKTASIDVLQDSSPIEITPTSGNTAMKKATVTLTNVPIIEANKTASINVMTAVSPVEITPSSGKTVMEKATVALTNVPVLEANKTKTIDVLNDSSNIEIQPSYGNTAMELVSVTLTNRPVLEENKTATITTNGSTEITPTSGKTAMKKVTVTTNIPLEANKTATITNNGVTEITPTSGKTAMQKVTITANVVSLNIGEVRAYTGTVPDKFIDCTVYSEKTTNINELNTNLHIPNTTSGIVTVDSYFSAEFNRLVVIKNDSNAHCIVNMNTGETSIFSTPTRFSASRNYACCCIDHRGWLYIGSRYYITMEGVVAPGTILRSKDWGKTFEEISTSFAGITKIKEIGNTLYILGKSQSADRSGIAYSTDGLENYSYKYPNTTIKSYTIYDLIITSENLLCAMSSSGTNAYCEVSGNGSLLISSSDQSSIETRKNIGYGAALNRMCLIEGNNKRILMGISGTGIKGSLTMNNTGSAYYYDKNADSTVKVTPSGIVWNVVDFLVFNNRMFMASWRNIKETVDNGATYTTIAELDTSIADFISLKGSNTDLFASGTELTTNCSVVYWKALNKTTYSALYNVIGDQYNDKISGLANTQFVIPLLIDPNGIYKYCIRYQ